MNYFDYFRKNDYFVMINICDYKKVLKEKNIINSVFLVKIYNLK